MVHCVEDLDTVVQDIHDTGLLSQQMVAMVVNDPKIDDRTKIKNLLHCAMGLVTSQTHLLEKFLHILRNQPNANNLLLIIQASRSGESLMNSS